MATLKFRDEDGKWQYAPSLKYKDANGIFQNNGVLKYKDANGVWQKVRFGRSGSGGSGSDDGEYPTIDTLTVGSSVYLNENVSPVKYLVVHKGLPDSTLYDASCDGVWLLRKDLCVAKTHGSSSNDYSTSSIHTYLNDEFLTVLDEAVQSMLKEVKIPYGGMSGGTIYSGENGLTAKAFSLSLVEMGFTETHVTYLPIDGAKLDYFEIGTGTNANTKRIAYLNGSATQYTSRSPHMLGSSYFKSVGAGGSSGLIDLNSLTGIRPCMILPHTAKIDPDTNTIIG